MNEFQLNEINDSDGADEKLLVVALNGTTEEKPKQKNDGITFTEGLTKTSFGKFNCFLIFISGIVLSNVLLETTAIGFILPIAECDLQLTNSDKGLLSAIGFAGIIVSSHLWGFLADTQGRRTVIRPTLLAGFIVTLLSSFSTKLWIMVVLRFISGFFASGGSATIYAYLGEFHTEKTRSRAMMGSSFVFALGAMILPVLAFLVINREWAIPIPFLDIEYKPWRLFLVVCGAPGFLCGLSLWILPESPKFLLSIGKEEKVISALKQMYRWNGGKGELEITHILPDKAFAESKSMEEEQLALKDSNFVIAFMKTMWNQTVPLFRKRYLRTTVFICIIQFWFFVITNGLYIWFPHIINIMSEFMTKNPGKHMRICEILAEKQESQYKTDGSFECIDKLEHRTYFYSLTMEILYATSFALIGLVINRVGKITVLVVCTIFFSACGVAAVLVTDPSIASYLYVLVFLVGVGINVLSAATVDFYPTHLRAMAICISLMIGRLGGVVGANVVGVMLEDYCELTFHVSCFAMMSCVILILFLPRRNPEESPAIEAVDNC